MRLFVSPPSWTTRKNRGVRPRTSIDLSPFLSIMVVLLFIVMFGNMYPIHRRQASADIPMTEHSTLQPAALREDALEVAVTRDGTVYFRNHRILPADLPDALREAASDGAEKTVYVKADSRAKYGDVKAALDLIRQSGLQNITFLTNHPAAIP
jgi:biopolymer transport protein TolR